MSFENKKKKVYRVRTQYIFEGVFEVVAKSREEAQQKVIQNCGLVMGGNIHSTLPDEKVNWAFSTARCKDGTDNCSRRTDRVKRSANPPTAPFFRELRRIKKGEKKPNEKHLVTFDSELRRLKSNKKPMLRNCLNLVEKYCYASIQYFVNQLFN